MTSAVRSHGGAGGGGIVGSGGEIVGGWEGGNCPDPNYVKDCKLVFYAQSTGTCKRV